MQMESFEAEPMKETFGDEVVIEELPGDVGERQEAPEDVPVTAEEAPGEAGTEEVPDEEVQEEPPAEEMAAPVCEEYTVQAGDTLAGISRQKYGDEQMVEKICELNGIADGDYIQVGEIILLP